jgi:hypothetical protein
VIPGILLLAAIGYLGKRTEQGIAAYGKAHHLALPNIEYVLWAILFGKRSKPMQGKRIALVTGANQGIGLQVAKELVANGVTVFVGSRNFERGEAAAKEIGPAAIPLQLDVTDRASIADAAERICKEFGRLDLLVNNAGISNTRKGSLSIPEYVKISRAAPCHSTRSAPCGRPTYLASSPFIRRCCRFCASRRTPASSTCLAG